MQNIELLIKRKGSLVSQWREARIKRNIFQGIFEENLRIAGMVPENAEKERNPSVVKGFLFIAALILYTSLNHFSPDQSVYRKISPPREASSAQSSSVQFSPASLEETQPDIATYNAILQQSLVPLRDLFGLQVKVIVIDPGHGGEDPGTRGLLGTEEKHITLDVAKKLRQKLLQHFGYQVLLTREEDVTVTLQERTSFAKAHHADLFISLHVNYIPNKPYGIVETYYFGADTDAVTLKLAQQENQGASYSMNDFQQMLQSISHTIKRQESYILARCLQTNLFRNIHRQNDQIFNYGIKKAPFVVLLGAEMPSVLSEITCLNNTEEEKKLNSTAYRDEIAGYLEEGIRQYVQYSKNRNQQEV